MGADTYTSAASEVSSQRTTVARKLRIITPTPTVAETATMSAATATPVRESLATTPRAAMRPVRPRSPPSGGPAARAAPIIASGVRSAALRIMVKSPA